MTIVFSRYLYNTDEVKLTFIECLLKQENLNECYFWIYEYYKSGYVRETWKLLYKVYYDFFALKNPKMEKKINIYYEKWKEDNNVMHILWVVKNLFRFEKDYIIFMLRIYYNTRNTDNLIGTDIIIDGFQYKKKEEIFLVKAIQQKKKIAISYYLKKLIKSSSIIELLEKVLKKTISLNKFYDNIYHQLLVIIIKSFKIESKKKVYYKIVKVKEMKEVLTSDDSCQNDGKHEDVSYIYKTLPKRRLYGVSSNLGCFKLCRDNIDLNHKFWYNWEYYAYKCPIWAQRFNKYKIKVNNKKELIDFENDNDLEEFYEEYGYEPDEQSKEVQEKSIKKIEKLVLKKWINGLFKNQLTKNIRIKIVY